MQTHNYTNPADRGRFGFSESGEFRAPYKSEHFIIAVLVALGITFMIIAGAGIIGAVNYMLPEAGVSTNEYQSNTIFYKLAGVIAFVVAEIVIAAVFIILMKYVLQGYVCTYVASEDKLIVNIGGTTHTFYYNEVQKIEFVPRGLFKKINGYTVYMIINNATETYAVTSTGYISEKTTPFWIIKERQELIHENESRNKANEAVSSLADASLSASGSSVSAADAHTPEDKMSHVLGSTNSIPSVSAPARTSRIGIPEDIFTETETATEIPITEKDEDTAADSSGYSQKLSPLMEEPKMLSVDETPKYDPIVMGKDGRETRENDTVTQGTYLEPYNFITISVAVFISLCVIAFAVYLLNLGLSPYSPLPNGICVFGSPVVAFIGFMITKVVISGREITYKANGREFRIYRKGRLDERILYSDVTGITYHPYRIMWVKRGYNVEIVTRTRTIRYSFLYPGLRRFVSEKDLPFEIIKQYMK